MKNKIFILVITLVISTSSLILVSSEFEVIATPAGGGGYEGTNDTFLDYTFIWTTIDKLSDVVHSRTLWNVTNRIRKGRAFGTPGDNWTANFIKTEMDKMKNISNVDKDKLDTVESNDEKSNKPWFCNYKFEAIDFKLEINNDEVNYPYTNPMPKNETFVIPAAYMNLSHLSYDFNLTFNNASIVYKDREDIINKKGATTNHYYNVTGFNDTSFYNICGNATYIELNDTLPTDQEGRVFLFPEEQGVEDYLNNVTNASAVILIHNTSKSQGEQHWVNTNNYTIQIGRVNKSVPDGNMSKVIEKLKDNTLILVDNYIDNDTLMFFYNISCFNEWWLDEHFFVVTYAPDVNTLYHRESTILYYLNALKLIESPDSPQCFGFITYDKNDYYSSEIDGSAHIMDAAQALWRGKKPQTKKSNINFGYNYRIPSLPYFNINYTVGDWLKNHTENTTVSGYFEQADNFVDAYNVLGHKNIENNPQDKITILSSRYDSWWGECPGDSGVGVGIMLGIAKYFNDHNITPINNLTFLFTTGEEYLYRGAWYHSITHKSDNIVRWIGTDQLGMNTPNFGQRTDISDNNPNGDGAIIDTIADIYNLEEESGYGYDKDISSNGEGLDAIAFASRDQLWGPSYACKAICIVKGRMNKSSEVKWDSHHRAGLNYTEGDSMKYIDPKDVNATFNYTWGIVKYYCVNPDSWFESVTYTAIDTDDDNSYFDSIKADFTIKSILPHDYIMVNATLRENNAYGDVYNYSCMNYSINSTGLETSINLTLPEDETEGYFVLRLDLFNSTGWIDAIVAKDYDNSDFINQTDFSIDTFLHPYNSHKNPPNITNITVSPELIGYGFNINISADVTSPVGSDIDIVGANISYPDKTLNNFSMSNTVGDTYQVVFNGTWQRGEYNFHIWAKDVNGNISGSSYYNFNVSSEAKMTVCTIKDTYAKFERVNLTDPPVASDETSQDIGYEFLDNGDILRIWNCFDSYYFNVSNGIQFTNHKDDYWSTNVLMLGYYNNDIWNLIYRTDELSGFNKNIKSNNETYVNTTLWKDLTYGGYDFRLAIRYYLGVDDNELTVIPYIKNIDNEDIPYVLGFGWELKDIQIDITTSGDYIDIDGTSYYLTQTLDETYSDMSSGCYYIKEDFSDTRTKSLYLKWNENLNYKVKVKSQTDQYNAPITLFIRVGTLDSDQEKYTKMYWYDADQVTYYFDDHDENEKWQSNPGYMVDGNESNYASTTSPNYVQLCDNNTCNGSYLGTISKVEIRTKAYYTGFPVDLKLRPIFGGTKDGNNYTYDVPWGSGAWSNWFEINDSSGMGYEGWNWSQVKDLDCDVQSTISFGMFTLYCSKVEICVTYTPNFAPVISDPYPTDKPAGISIAPKCNISVSDADNDLMNITWLWYNESADSWQVFGANNSVNGSVPYHQVYSNASVNGQKWLWMVNVSDGTCYVLSDGFDFYTGYESKINNSGSTNLSGYLFMSIEFYNTSSEEWDQVLVVVNETTPRILNIDGQLGLDTVFNPYNVTTDDFSNGSGTYRLYVALRDSAGNVLFNDVSGGGIGYGQSNYIEAWYEFSLTGS